RFAVGEPTPRSATTSSAPAARASTETAAPPARKFATICAVTSGGYAETPAAATPWSAAATTIAARSGAGTAPRIATMRLPSSSMRPRLPRGFVLRSQSSDIEPLQRQGPPRDDEVGPLRRVGPRGVDAPEQV